MKDSVVIESMHNNCHSLNILVIDLRKPLLQTAKVYDVIVSMLCLLYVIGTVKHCGCLDCQAHQYMGQVVYGLVSRYIVTLKL